MFQTGDRIIYGSTGVCRVDDIAPLESGGRGADGRKLYYKLFPLYSDGFIFTPVDTGVFMRPILSEAEVNLLIDRIPAMPEEVCDETNLRQLSDRYHAVISTHCCEDLLCLIKSIYQKGRQAAQRGKRPGAVDQQYKKQAEQLVHGEFAAALGIDLEEVPSYIEARISTDTAARPRMAT